MRSLQAHSKREVTRSASRTRMARAAFGECLVETEVPPISRRFATPIPSPLAALLGVSVPTSDTLLAKSDVTPEEILDVANDVQIKDQSRLSSRAEIDEARTDAWLAICDLADAVKTGTADNRMAKRHRFDMGMAA